jgi:hypothetical protein
VRDNIAITPAELAHHARALAGAEHLPKHIFSTLYELGFSTPSAGKKHTNELEELADFIRASADGAILRERLLALVFDLVGDVFEENVAGDEPLLEQAWLDLGRAVAVFFVRVRALDKARGDD